MPRAAIVDTGPLVACLDKAERHHGWTVEQVPALDAPLPTCEPVLAEAMFLLSDLPKAQEALFDLLANGAVRIAFQVGEHVAPLRALHRYNSATARSRSPMPASCAWRSCSSTIRCSPWTPIFRFTAGTAANRWI